MSRNAGCPSRPSWRNDFATADSTGRSVFAKFQAVAYGITDALDLDKKSVVPERAVQGNELFGSWGEITDLLLQ